VRVDLRVDEALHRAADLFVLLGESHAHPSMVGRAMIYPCTIKRDFAMEKRRRMQQYQERYAADYGFEAVMVSARQRVILELLRKLKPGVVLEIGCGSEPLSGRVAKAGIAVEQWLIVEPGEAFLESARGARIGQAKMEFIPGFIEDAAATVKARCIRLPELVLCSGMLNEVEDPELILRTAKGLLGPAGVLHVSVPNALSLHRRLARAMGLIRTESQMTARNLELAQYRVFDFDSLVAVAERAGLRVVERGGYFLKPFTHAQMESLGDLLSQDMLDGLWQLGRELPELASEIFVNLQP
jgi:2-polyprenyl-3-methyl-5-hydroxy-6-metoxy-1,4-benzoquinol methylase